MKETMLWNLAIDQRDVARVASLRNITPTLERLKTAFGLRRLAALLGSDPSNLNRFLTGERNTPDVVARRAIDLEHILARASRLFEPEVVVDWLNGNEPFLNDARPIDVLALKGAGPLIDALDAIASGGYA